MALSGTFYTNVNNNWRLQLEWSATQSVANNTSTITTKLYWMGLNQYGTTYSTATKSGSSTIDGTASAFSGASLGKLTGAEKKLIKTHSKTVTHNADGSKSVALSAFFNVELTLNSYYGRVDVSGTAVLNTIPRASSLINATPTWTAGGSLSLGVSRASSSFTHTAKISVDGTLVKTVTGIATDSTVSFTTAENTTIFTKLAQGTSKTATIELITYNGSTVIGTKTYTGSVSSPARSTTTWGGDFNIGATLKGLITRNNSTFTHTIQLVFGSTTFTLHNKTTATDWSYATSSIASSLYALTPISTSMSGKIRIYTYYNGIQVGAVAEGNIIAYAKDNAITFSDSQISYADTNATTKAITGDATYIIQNQSDLTVTLNSLATIGNSATVKSYDFTVNGVTKSLTATGSVAFGKVNANTNVTMKVRVTDSRGNYKEVSKIINMVEYKPVVVNANMKRVNNYEASTSITLSGSLSLIPVGATPANKNVLTATTGLQYRFKESTTSTWGGWTNFAWTTSGANYTATTVTKSFDNTKTYNFEFKATDKLGTYTVSKTLSAGSPILFVDAVKKSVGVGKFPTKSDSLEVAGVLDVPTINATSVTTTGNTKVGNALTVTGNFYADSTLNVAKKSNLNGDLAVAGVTTLNGNLYANGASSSNYLGRTFIRYGGQALTVGANEQDHVYIGFDARKGVANRSGWVGYGADGATAFTVSNSIGNVEISPSSNLTTFKGAINLTGQITNPAVTYPSLLNGWVNYGVAGGAFERAGYFKDKNGTVFINGLVKNGTAGTVIFTLPVGYRPIGTIMFTSNTNGALARVDVGANGNVSCTSASYPSSWVSLGGLSFKAV